MPDKLTEIKTNLREYFAGQGDNGDQRSWSELKKSEGIDPLTGFLNRAVFKERAKSVLGRNRKFALIMFDIDNFKKINDQHGHFGGDFVLSRISAVILNFIRESDLVCRWGGDEIVILLPDILDDAKTIAERFRSAIENERFVSNTKSVGYTASFGVALGSGIGKLDIAINQADKAMYHAKNAGRNKVVVA